MTMTGSQPTTTATTCFAGKLVFPHFQHKFERQQPTLHQCYYSMFEVAKKKGVRTMRDWLILYNEGDELPFLEAALSYSGDGEAHGELLTLELLSVFEDLLVGG